MLVENTLFGTKDKIAEAVRVLRENEPKEGYFVAFSGGKDSTVVLDLVRRAGVKHDAHYNLTTVDPPELIYHIRRFYPEVWDARIRPKMSMWQLIVKHRFPPTRKIRYCCEELKEAGDEKNGRTIVTGIRAEESKRRANRKQVEDGIKLHVHYVHPILHWTKEDIWDYIKENKLPYCKLYDEGFERIGCVMCPYQSKRTLLREMARYPQYAELYRTVCNRAYEAGISAGKEYKEFNSGDDMFEWWIRGRAAKHCYALDEMEQPLFNDGDF